MSLRKLAALCSGAALILSPALASAQSINGLSVKDGAGSTQSLCTYIISSTYQLSCYAPLWYNGSAFVPTSTSNPLPVAATGAASAFADGWDLTQGTKADTAWTGSGSGSVIAILKAIYNSSIGSIPAGAATIGNTNAFQNSSGVVLPPAADSSAAINVSTATTTQIVALASSKKIYVSSFDVIAGGTGNITFVYGTGSNCGTGTTSLTGPYNLTAQAGIAKGNGLGAVLVVPASNALCVTTSAAVQMSGSVSYTQF